MQEQAEQERLTELSVADAVSVALQLHRRGFLDEAQTIYRRVLAIEPEHADALHFLGVAMHQTGGHEEAVTLIRRSIAAAPDHADRYNNLGNVLVEREQLEEAVAAYRQAIVIDPGHADAHSNLGAALRALRRYDEAEAALRTAIERNPGHADAHNNLGNLFAVQGRTREAVTHFCKAVTLVPQHAESNAMLGIAYCVLGETDRAAAVYRAWLEKDPANPVARHLYAACSGRNTPKRASDAFVESIFDAFASSFDAKLGRLSYQAPQLVAAAAARRCGHSTGEWVGLDAGCGTGLCGALIKPYVGRLVGVDLSAGMLAKAHARGVYDELVKAELTEFLEARSDEYRLIVCADTLCYFGELDALLQNARRALREQGLLVFTVEALTEPGTDYRLMPHGRYSHDRGYVERAMTRAGFTDIEWDTAVLRNESGSPVAGLIVSARGTALAAPAGGKQGTETQNG